MSDLKTYNLAGLTQTLGAFPLSRGAGASGYGPDVVISLKKKEPDFKSIVGADGTVTWVATNNNQHELEITTMQSNSPTNGYLSSVRATAFAAGVPLVLPYILKDENGTTVFSASKCVLTGPADAEYGADAKPRTWKFECDPELNLIGGN